MKSEVLYCIYGEGEVEARSTDWWAEELEDLVGFHQNSILLIGPAVFWGLVEIGLRYDDSGGGGSTNAIPFLKYVLCLGKPHKQMEVSEEKLGLLADA